MFSWEDPRLSWDGAQNGNIETLRIDSSAVSSFWEQNNNFNNMNSYQVWIPDITLYTAAEPTMENYVTWDDSTNVVVFSSGTVLYVPPQLYSVVLSNYVKPWSNGGTWITAVYFITLRSKNRHFKYQEH